MGTEIENNGSTDETTDQEQQGQQQTPPGETPGKEEKPPTITIDDSTKLPETHPLVKTLAANKTKIATQNSELSEARAQAAKVTALETELAARPSQEAVDTLQTRYDRLEAFLQSAGGPLGQALDSRTFTKDLFETDKDIETIVKDWNRANPSATSQALGSAAAAPAGSGTNMNDLLRKAAK